MKRVPLTLLLIAAACAPRADSTAPETKPTPKTAALAASVPSCFNTRYRFTCQVPQGYLVTQERPGPGTVLTMVKRQLGSRGGANLEVRVAPLKGQSLERFVETRIGRDLEKAKGVLTWNKQAAVVGGRAGVEVLTEREYANGVQKQRIFLFVQDGNVFIADHFGPQATADREREALDRFVSDLQFQPKR